MNPSSTKEAATASVRPDASSLPATPIALLAVRIVEAMKRGTIAYVADDEVRARALAEAAQAFAPDATIVFVPANDALPGEDAPATPANAGARVAALRRLRVARRSGQAVACIAGPEAVARLYATPDAFDRAPPTIAIGDAIDPATFDETVATIGYTRDDRVDEPGQVAIRGEVIDIFPADCALPVRIERIDGHVSSIRSYDPVSQRSDGDRDTIEIGRAAEPAATGGVSLLAHLEPGAIVVEAKVPERRKRFLALAADAGRRGAQASVLSDADWQAVLEGWQRLRWDDADGEAVARFAQTKAPLRALARLAKPILHGGGRMILTGHARDLRFLRRRVAKTLGTTIADVGDWDAATAVPPGAVAALESPVDAGFRRDDLLVVAAGDLLGSRALRGAAAAGSALPIGGTTAIRIGDVVVHEDHGIGVVDGLEPLPDPNAGDAIVLRYADAGRRLVPVADADRIWRYGADEGSVTLDKLDGASWQKRRGAIDAAIAESAKGLTALAAERARRSAPVIEPDPAAYERFAADFPFTETADQSRAIGAVRDDLAAGTPMDRLVIGDVGYGKTEVALRAAALVALTGGQVAIAAPTTVLVRQHVESFRRRFAGSGIVVDTLSRLSSAADRKRVKAGLADGSIRIVIGTGAIAGKGVRYKALRLVVIDEEQRFGAADKAKLRGGADVHVLTLSATPIPRTLQTALVGLQQLSVIATPPARRQPIRTVVEAFDDVCVRTALIRERGRGGQSFVVVPRIEDIAPLAERLHRLAPELDLIQAHGKLPAAELDQVMVRFAEGAGDVLLATNIIEAGLDVPRANTMIVWHADRFGLAQLHQLRGRVGRGNRRGQVLLTTEGDATIAPRTLKRLRTLQAFDRLGAGFAISARDLDMRGAGDLLGEAQAGHMKLIGVDLYQYLLGAALRQARGEDVERWTPELNLGAEGRLPEDWILEAETRIELYARLSRVTEAVALDALEDELEDRFGPLPPAAAELMAMARLRVLARAAGIARIDAGPAAIALTPRAGAAVGALPDGIAEKNGRLLLAERIEAADARAQRIGELLETMIGSD